MVSVIFSLNQNQFWKFLIMLHVGASTQIWKSSKITFKLIYVRLIKNPLLLKYFLACQINSFFFTSFLSIKTQQILIQLIHKLFYLSLSWLSVALSTPNFVRRFFFFIKFNCISHLFGQCFAPIAQELYNIFGLFF